MFEETRDDVCVGCFLLKIHDTFEVGTVFGLVGCSGERDVNMFTGDPLVKVIFDLKEVLALLGNRNNPKIKTYHRLHESNGGQWKYVVLGKLRVYNTVVFFILEPDLIDKGLYQRRTKYAGF